MHSLAEILLPTDFSPSSVEVARYAAALARSFHSRLTLLHAIAPLYRIWSVIGTALVFGEVLEQMHQETRRRLDLFLGTNCRDWTLNVCGWRG